eukprot:scaffold15409_cov35-Tisochrysis_lutea.AAC.2
MSDDEDYGFEYSEDDQEEEDVNIENQYYSSKALRETDEEGAVEGFKEVAEMESSKGARRERGRARRVRPLSLSFRDRLAAALAGEWGFKAYKMIVKLQFKRGKWAEMMAAYKEMLTYIRSAVTRNYSEKVINKILDLVSSSQQMELLQELYETTLSALQEAKNERLWFKTNLKLGKLWFDRAQYGRLQRIIKVSCRLPSPQRGACLCANHVLPLPTLG